MVKIERVDTPEYYARLRRRSLGLWVKLTLTALLITGVAALAAATNELGYTWQQVARFGTLLAPLFGAVTVAARSSPSGFIRSNESVWNVTATADADTTATIAHGLGVVPDRVFWAWSAPEARISLWNETIASRDVTNVVMNKQTTAGSGAAGVQLVVYVQKPHTLTR